MKKKQVFLLFALLCATKICMSQAVSVSSNLPVNLYIGIDNSIHIEAENVANSDIKVAIDNGTIQSQGNGNYLVRVKKIGFAQLTVTNKKGKVLKTIQLPTRRIEDPIAILIDSLNQKLYKTPTYILENEMKALYSFVPEYPVPLMTIESFDVTTMNKGFSETQHSASQTFTASQQQAIKNAEPLSKIYIENIKARHNDATIRNLAPIVLIKDYVYISTNLTDNIFRVGRDSLLFTGCTRYSTKEGFGFLHSGKMNWEVDSLTQSIDFENTKESMQKVNEALHKMKNNQKVVFSHLVGTSYRRNKFSIANYTLTIAK